MIKQAPARLVSRSAEATLAAGPLDSQVSADSPAQVVELPGLHDEVHGLKHQHPSWANLVRSGSGLDGFDDPRDMVG